MNNIDNSKSQASLMLSVEEIREVAGFVTDLTAAAILGMQATKQDLLVAVYFTSGQGDLVDRAGHELSGKAAQIFEILKRDELYLDEER